MDILLAQCSQMIAQNNGIYTSMLMAGLIGSLTHCSTMCGPIVAAQIMSPTHHNSSFIWYHAGRITTYVVLGIIASIASYWIFSQRFAQFSHIMLFLAGTLFIISAVVPNATHQCNCKLSGFTRWIETMIPNASLQLYLHGLLLGFMPCGLVVAALLLVTTTHNTTVAASSMLVFGLATVPVLQLIGYTARKSVQQWKPLLSTIGRAAMTVNGAVLCVLGMNVL